MKLVLASVGKLKSGPERALFEHYAGRVGGIGKSVALGPVSEISVAESRKDNANARKADEADALLDRILDQAAIIAFDEKGKTLTSSAFELGNRAEMFGGRPVCNAFWKSADTATDMLTSFVRFRRAESSGAQRARSRRN